jgi:hypothetical protein
MLMGLIVSVADLMSPLYVAEMSAVAAAATVVVETVKVALWEPPGITTFAGTVALGFELASVTVTPAAGAGPFNVTVAVLGFPPSNAVGAREMPESAVGVTFSVVDTVAPL